MYFKHSFVTHKVVIINNQDGHIKQSLFNRDVNKPVQSTYLSSQNLNSQLGKEKNKQTNKPVTLIARKPLQNIDVFIKFAGSLK